MAPKSSHASDLRSECLSFPEILAQSVANIVPTSVPTTILPLVFATAGKGAWLTFVIATIGLVLVSLNINQFARRSASPGALYAYIARGLGPTVGVLSGWALVLAYLFGAMAALCAFANYGNVFLGLSGVQVSPILLYAVCTGIAWYVGYRDIQLSTMFMLVLELFSVSLILTLALIVLWQHGFKIDTSQITLEGVSLEGVRLGLVLAIFSYTGFESATVLGDEAKKPLKYIPGAVVWSTVLSGLFFILLSYTEVLGFSAYHTPLDKSDAPLNVLAELAGVKFFGTLISTAALISFFSCVLANINAGSRILFLMAYHGIFHPSLSQAHRTNKTPHIAGTMSALLAFLVPASMSLFGLRVLDILGYLGTIGTYGFLVAYILISVATPVYLYREGRLRPANVVISVLAILFMLISVVGSVYPAPPTPYNVFPYLFLMLLAVGGGWLLMLRLHSPEIIEDMERDIEAIHNRFSDLKKV